QQNISSQNTECQEAEPKVLNSTEEQIELSPEEIINQLKKELAEKHDLMLRTAADAQNTRKRAEKDILDAKNYALSSFAKDIIAVCDNLERSLEAAKQQLEANPKNEICNSL